MKGCTFIFMTLAIYLANPHRTEINTLLQTGGLLCLDHKTNQKENTMNRSKFFSVFMLVTLLSACTTIPQESVDLSSEVGIGIQKQHQSQIELINLHFSINRNNLDAAMQTALSSYFTALAPKNSITLNKAQLENVAEDIILINQKNNVAKEELEKARVFLIKKLSENYLILSQANSTITGLLQSAVTVKEARSEAYKKLYEATDRKIDLSKVFSELDEFILKNGEKSGKGIGLVEKIQTILDKE